MFQTAETVDAIVSQLMDKQRQLRLNTSQNQRRLECSCGEPTCTGQKHKKLPHSKKNAQVRNNILFTASRTGRNRVIKHIFC